MSTNINLENPPVISDSAYKFISENTPYTETDSRYTDLLHSFMDHSATLKELKNEQIKFAPAFVKNERYFACAFIILNLGIILIGIFSVRTMVLSHGWTLITAETVSGFTIAYIVLNCAAIYLKYLKRKDVGSMLAFLIIGPLVPFKTFFINTAALKKKNLQDIRQIRSVMLTEGKEIDVSLAKVREKALIRIRDECADLFSKSAKAAYASHNNSNNKLQTSFDPNKFTKEKQNELSNQLKPAQNYFAQFRTFA